MNFEAPEVLSTMQAVKSTISFNFGSESYREAFFVTTSYYQIDFGFLYNLANAAKTVANFRCLVYENNDGVLTLSSKWKKLDFTSFPIAKLYSKETIDEPASYLFNMKCIGAGVPTGPAANNMALKWRDGSNDVQIASSISMPNYIPATTGSYTINPSIHTKRFKSQGMKAFYTFTLQASQDLDENSRIYFDFNFNLNSRLDREGKVECYIRQTAATTDADAVFSYCDFTYTNQLVIWNNIDISSSSAFFIDIFNIDVPKTGDTSPNLITVSLDPDSDYENGVLAIHSFADSASSNTAIGDLVITDTSMSTSFIRSPQTITIEFTLLRNSGQQLSVLAATSCLRGVDQPRADNRPLR